ncbi:MAG: hypothetical protein Q9207_001613 [Kuettlingeria erythrocarpa]
MEYPLGLRTATLPLVDNRCLDGHPTHPSASVSSKQGTALGSLGFDRSRCPSPSPSFRYNKSCLESYSGLDNSVLSAFGNRDRKSIPLLSDFWEQGYPPFAAPEPITVFAFTTRGVSTEDAEVDKDEDMESVGPGNRTEDEVPSFNIDDNSGLPNMSPVTVLHVPTMLSAKERTERCADIVEEELHESGATTDTQSSDVDRSRNTSQTVYEPVRRPRNSEESAVSSLHPVVGEPGPSNYQELPSPRQREKSKASDDQQEVSLKSLWSSDLGKPDIGAVFSKRPLCYPRRDIRNYPHLRDMLNAAANPVGDLPSTHACSSDLPTPPLSDEQAVGHQDSASASPDTTSEYSGKPDCRPADVSATVSTPEGIQYQFLDDDRRDNQTEVFSQNADQPEAERRVVIAVRGRAQAEWYRAEAQRIRAERAQEKSEDTKGDPAAVTPSRRSPLTKYSLVDQTEQEGEVFVQVQERSGSSSLHRETGQGQNQSQSQHDSVEPQSQGDSVQSQSQDDESNAPPADKQIDTSSLLPEGTMSVSLREQKQQLAEALYPKILILQPDFANKITGLLLEMHPLELLPLTKDNEKLEQKVTETLSLLDHYVETEGALPPSKPLEPLSNDAVSPKTVQDDPKPQGESAHHGRRTVPIQRRGSGEPKTWSKYLEGLERLDARELQQISSSWEWS